MASDYAYGIEMKRALERHNRGEAYVIPVILRPVYWQGLLGNLQALPKDAIPVTDPDWHNLDRAFFDVAEGIHKVVKNILSHPSSEYIAFEQIIPTKDQWWTNSAIGGIYVPIGYKSGTTNQQILELGKNIYQHALVVGNDFNKNALLHTFIMNLSLLYSPNEIEIYMVDFKGVEDTLYITRQLPHSRVISIGSDRKLGLNVSTKLYQELERRKDLFARIGVQDLYQVRKFDLDRTWPRILLLVDEFQRFFLEDDKVAQDASLFLNTLIRQGRAFGINVLLWSQKMTELRNFARSTLDQIAIRIVMKCDEADAKLALSNDNQDSRILYDLHRYEGIYNNALGSAEGNTIFQYALLANSRIYEYCGQIDELSKRNHIAISRPIIFDTKLTY